MGNRFFDLATILKRHAGRIGKDPTVANNTESTINFVGERFKIGNFRCAPSSDFWSTENISGQLPLVVFPRTAVEIHQADRHPVVATPNHAMFYNTNHSYRRDLIDPRGDMCEFYAVSPKLLEEVLRSIGAPPPGCPELPFEFSHSLCSSEIYIAQRTLFQTILNDEHLDPFFVEEQFLLLLPKILDQAFRFHDSFRHMKSGSAVKRREQVEAAKDYVSRNFRKPISLISIADYIECSVYHLCRIFKKLTGQTIHHFLLQFRLRTAIELVLEKRTSLTSVALELGFSSHSHFTNSFRQRFNLCPNGLRNSDARAMCKRLIHSL